MEYGPRCLVTAHGGAFFSNNIDDNGLIWHRQRVYKEFPLLKDMGFSAFVVNSAENKLFGEIV